MEAASKTLLERGNHVDARAIALKWVELAPLSEAAHRLAMRAIAKTGDRTGALQQYQTCERLLRDELGVAPDAETISRSGRCKIRFAEDNLPQCEKRRSSR